MATVDEVKAAVDALAQAVNDAKTREDAEGPPFDPAVGDAIVTTANDAAAVAATLDQPAP